MNTREAFLKFDYKKNCLDEFIWPFLRRLTDSKELCTMCKVTLLSHGQSFTGKGFSIKKEEVDDNMKEKSLISQSIVYDTIQSYYDGKVRSYTRISKGLQIGTSKVQVRIRKQKSGKKEDNVNRKRKLKQEEIQNVKKKRKQNVEDAINALRKISIVKYQLLTKNKP